MDTDKYGDLLLPSGGYRRLKSFQLAQLIYDITVRFVELYIPAESRTCDQMVQAARSGKQNIVEGNVDAATSVEMGIRLLNVAKASFRELLADYEDYLRVNSFEIWPSSSSKCQAMRRLGREGDNAKMVGIAKPRSMDVVANMAIILIKQEDYLLHQLLKALSERFIEEGGFKEKMHRVRMQYRTQKR